MAGLLRNITKVRYDEKLLGDGLAYHRQLGVVNWTRAICHMGVMPRFYIPTSAVIRMDSN